MITLGVPLDKSAPGVDLKRAFFIDLDINGDGHISLDEFLATVEKRTAHITADTSVAWGEVVQCMDRRGFDAATLFEKVRALQQYRYPVVAVTRSELFAQDLAFFSLFEAVGLFAFDSFLLACF